MIVCGRTHKGVKLGMAVVFLIAAFTVTMDKHGIAQDLGLDNCGRLIGRKVTTDYQEIKSVADLQIRNNDQYVIRVNPYRSDLGRETVRWLYFRQCALLDRMGADARRREPNAAEQRWADCEAVELMQRERRLDRHDLKSIHRDLDSMDSREWNLNLGPERAVDLYRCD